MLLRDTFEPAAEQPRVLDLRGSHEGGPAGFGVLEDPSGRRRRRMRWLARGTACLLVLWLVALLFGGLGLVPTDGVPFAGALNPPTSPPAIEARPRSSLPPPARQTASPSRRVAVTRERASVDRRRDDRRPRVTAPRERIAPVSGERRKPERSAASPVVPTPIAAPVQTASPGRSAPTAPGGSGTTPGHATAPGRPTSPGQAETAPGQATSPGRTGTAPGQATSPAQSETAPGRGALARDDAPAQHPDHPGAG